MPHLCLEVFPDMTTMGHLYQPDFSLQLGTAYINNRSSLQIILLQNKSYFVNINIYFKAFLVYFSWDDFSHVSNKPRHILHILIDIIEVDEASACKRIYFKRCNSLLLGGWMNV